MTEPTDAEREARMFHEAYERLAPSFGYETRSGTREFDPASPNGKLMVAVCGELQSSRTPAPVGVEPVGEAGSMPGTDGFTMACFKASDVPIGTKLYTADQVIAMGRVPPNWPTNEMIEAGRKAAMSHGPLLGGGQSLWHVFLDMLAAAPSPQKQGGQHGISH